MYLWFGVGKRSMMLAITSVNCSCCSVMLGLFSPHPLLITSQPLFLSAPSGKSLIIEKQLRVSTETCQRSSGNNHHALCLTSSYLDCICCVCKFQERAFGAYFPNCKHLYMRHVKDIPLHSDFWKYSVVLSLSFKHAVWNNMKSCVSVAFAFESGLCAWHNTIQVDTDPLSVSTCMV